MKDDAQIAELTEMHNNMASQYNGTFHRSKEYTKSWIGIPSLLFLFSFQSRIFNLINNFDEILKIRSEIIAAAETTNDNSFYNWVLDKEGKKVAFLFIGYKHKYSATTYVVRSYCGVQQVCHLQRDGRTTIFF